MPWPDGVPDYPGRHVRSEGQQGNEREARRAGEQVVARAGAERARVLVVLEASEPCQNPNWKSIS